MIIKAVLNKVKALCKLAEKFFVVFDGNSMPGKVETKNARSLDVNKTEQEIQQCIDQVETGSQPDTPTQEITRKCISLANKPRLAGDYVSMDLTASDLCLRNEPTVIALRKQLYVELKSDKECAATSQWPAIEEDISQFSAIPINDKLYIATGAFPGRENPLKAAAAASLSVSSVSATVNSSSSTSLHTSSSTTKRQTRSSTSVAKSFQTHVVKATLDRKSAFDADRSTMEAMKYYCYCWQRKRTWERCCDLQADDLIFLECDGPLVTCPSRG